MANVSKERAVAIFLVKSFRQFLDLTMKPSNRTTNFTEAQMEKAKQMFFGSKKEPSPGLESKMRALFQKVTQEFLDQMNQGYDAALPEIVVSAISDIETHLTSTYTAEEIEGLYVVSQMTSAQKLMSDMAIFTIFSSRKHEMYLLMEDSLTSFTEGAGIKDTFQNSVQDLIDDLKKDDSDDDDRSLNPDDIF